MAALTSGTDTRPRTSVTYARKQKVGCPRLDCASPDGRSSRPRPERRRQDTAVARESGSCVDVGHCCSRASNPGAGSEQLSAPVCRIPNAADLPEPHGGRENSRWTPFRNAKRPNSRRASSTRFPPARGAWEQVAGPLSGGEQQMLFETRALDGSALILPRGVDGPRAIDRRVLVSIVRDLTTPQASPW